MNNELRAEEVALRLGVSTRTIDLWYRWKRKNPEHTLAKLLPEYSKTGVTRTWKEEDVESLIVFRDSKPNGRGGILGELTYRKKKEKE